MRPSTADRTESAGVIEAIGPGVAEFAVGDRVATVCRPDGAYAEARNAPAARVVRLPAGIDERTAASMMVRGMTARYLLRETYKVKPGDTVVVHAAAGGVGLILSQWAKQLGATVIGTVGSAEKAAVARGLMRSRWRLRNALMRAGAHGAHRVEDAFGHRGRRLDQAPGFLVGENFRRQRRVQRVAGAMSNDVTDDGVSDQRQVTDDIENLVADELVLETERVQHIRIADDNRVLERAAQR